MSRERRCWPGRAVPPVIYHLALRDDWDAAVAGGGTYDRSTLGRSVAEVGFVHCSLPGQVRGVADAWYRGRDDVVLLTIAVDRIGAEVRLEQVDGSGEAFPHVYGSLPVAAVTCVEAVALRADGTLGLGPLPG